MAADIEVLYLILQAVHLLQFFLQQFAKNKSKVLLSGFKAVSIKVNYNVFNACFKNVLFLEKNIHIYPFSY